MDTFVENQMNEFKVGDECWMFYSNYGASAWAGSTVIYPEHLEITQGKIVDIEENHVNVYIYVKGESQLISIGWTFFENWIFKSKSEAINAMIARLEELKDSKE